MQGGRGRQLVYGLVPYSYTVKAYIRVHIHTHTAPCMGEMLFVHVH